MIDMNAKIKVKTEVIKDPNAKVIEIPMEVWKKMKEQAKQEAIRELKGK